MKPNLETMSVGAIGLISVLLVSMTACETMPVSAIRDLHLTIERGGEVDPDEPFGACTYEGSNGTTPVFECSLDGQQCSGWGGGSCNPEEGCVAEYDMSCNHHCSTASQCPHPLSGDAQVMCHDGSCLLTCTDETCACPAGFAILPTARAGFPDGPALPPFICMQHTTLRTPY